MRQNLFGASSLRRHDRRADLAEAHAVPPSAALQKKTLRGSVRIPLDRDDKRAGE